jgi:N4-gp56 family major capsid protein
MALMDTLGANAGETLNVLQAGVYQTGATIVYSGGVANKSAVAQEIKLNDIKRAVNQLNRNSAMKFVGEGYGSQNYATTPIRSSYYGICHSDVEEDIRGLSGFVGVETYGGYTSTMPGEFGAVAGVRFSSTEVAPIETNTSTTSASQSGVSTYYHAEGGTGFSSVYWSVVYGKEAVGTIGLGEQYGTDPTVMYDPTKPQAVEIIYHRPGSSGVADPYNEIGSIAWKAFWGSTRLNSLWLVPIVSLSRNYS